jgi:predicted amino acid-binding ACT domain protein
MDTSQEPESRFMVDMVDHSQTEDDVNAVRHDLVYEKQQLDGEIIKISEKSVKQLSRK